MLSIVHVKQYRFCSNADDTTQYIIGDGPTNEIIDFKKSNI